MSKRILILGGYGETGRRLAAHLLKATDASVIIAGRHLDRAEELAGKLVQSESSSSTSELTSSRISTALVDAADSSSVLNGIQDNKADLLLVASPTTQYAEIAIRACLEAKVDYLDVQVSQTKLEVLRRYEHDIEKAGLTFITEAGYHPGLPAALVRYAATKLEAATDGMQIATATVGGYLNMGPDLPYAESVDELMVEMTHYRGQVYSQAKWTKPSSWSVRNIDFGEIIGQRSCSSWFLEELNPLPAMYPSMQELGFYMAGSNWLTDFVLSPIILLLLQLAPRRGVKPAGKLMFWGMRLSPPPHVCAVQCEATARRIKHVDDEMCLRLRVEHSDGYELTAIPVVACLMQYLEAGKRPGPGLHMMGYYVDPIRLIDDMEAMGIRVIREEDGLK